jgi:hypothetical protein
MRYALVLMTALLVSTAGCKKKGGGDMVAKMKEFSEKMCACPDKKCADGVESDYRKWVGETTKSAGNQAPAQSKEEADAFGQAATSYANCTQKKMAMGGDGSGSGSGSQTADKGSADKGSANTGSGSQTAAGPGSGSQGEDKGGLEGTHHAGNCPSMVLGSTTTAELKGKDIIVKVTSKDKDAIVAIQKRADALIKEKQDNQTGSAHDQKGTHGGGRGKCPVYVGDGGKAVAKNEADGVAITITAKDKPEELKKAIDERIAKAAEWVKTNIKDGDKGNQGGVGGGSGAHGANHSGQGDGKGKDRKGGDGKGTGSGTGGGGGAGTGGGSGAKKGSGG